VRNLQVFHAHESRDDHSGGVAPAVALGGIVGDRLARQPGHFLAKNRLPFRSPFFSTSASIHFGLTPPNNSEGMISQVSRQALVSYSSYTLGKHSGPPGLD
jgi:hypothetical protein